jgi:hypothetical protein
MSVPLMNNNYYDTKKNENVKPLDISLIFDYIIRCSNGYLL